MQRNVVSELQDEWKPVKLKKQKTQGITNALKVEQKVEPKVEEEEWAAPIRKKKQGGAVMA